MVEQKISINKAYVPSRKIAFRNIGGKSVLVDTAENRLITLNETASFIWQSLDGRSVTAIAQELALEFEIEQEKAMEDIVEFLTEIGSRQIIKEAK
jgi:hypothetical protein